MTPLNQLCLGSKISPKPGTRPREAAQDRARHLLIAVSITLEVSRVKGDADSPWDPRHLP